MGDEFLPAAVSVAAAWGAAVSAGPFTAAVVAGTVMAGARLSSQPAATNRLSEADARIARAG